MAAAYRLNIFFFVFGLKLKYSADFHLEVISFSISTFQFFSSLSEAMKKPTAQDLKNFLQHKNNNIYIFPVSMS
jgi:hypothetical protein